MKRVWVLVTALGLSSCGVAVPWVERQQFADVAAKLRAFPPDREFFGMDYGDRFGGVSIGDGMPLRGGLVMGHANEPTPGTAEYQRLLKADYPVQVLLALLSDADPKIRTLAAAAMVAKGDLRLQRHLRLLLDDTNPTFDLITIPMTDNYVPPSYTPQTVKMAVLRLVELRSKEEFDRYWALRGSRPYCADWFLWQFRHAEFAALARQEIAKVPSPDRELITLWIGTGKQGRFAGYSHDEMLAAAKQLGRENILAVLRNQAPTTDPDILNNNQREMVLFQHYSEMGHFLLTHAGDLLKPSDADTLLELEKAEQSVKNPGTPVYREWWAIGAAQLRPKETEAILDGGQERWPYAGNVALARWDIGGRAALPKILVWFYRSPETEKALAMEIYNGDMDEKYKPLVSAILASDKRLKISGETMYWFTYPKLKWKADFDKQYVDWIYAQPRDPHPELMAPPRGLVVQTSGVARKLVLDPRFENADALLVYEIQQRLVGGTRLKREEYLRMNQLVREMGYGLNAGVPEKKVRELRVYLRKEVGAE